jgi:hypothetical protein
MISDEEQELFDTTKELATDTISTLIEDAPHPALVYVALMSVIFEVITTEGFWDGNLPRFKDLRGFGNLMWKLREKAFADLATDSSVTISSKIIQR